jgi:ParB family chromosome partitioning protein
MTAQRETGKPKRRKALGRGLSALFESGTAPAAPPTAALAAAPPPAEKAPGRVPGKTLVQLPIEAIEPNPRQPRKNFEPEHLRELAASIRAQGLLQPIIVTPLGSPESATRFQLVIGERRLRAARLAGLTTVPALVQQTPKALSLELALIENLQREDLNPIEAATAFAQLAEEFDLTHEEIAQRTGKDRATITNFLRLLRLPVEVQSLVSEGRLSTGHAKALLGLSSPDVQRDLAKLVVARDLSVRATEKLVQVREARQSRQKPLKDQWDANVRAALHELERRLGTKVKLSGNTKRGKLLIEYYSEDDLMRIYDAIMREV